MIAIEKQGAVRVVRLQVPLTGEQCDKLRDSALKGLGAGRPMLVIDLHETPLIDGAGLETLIELRERIEARGGSVKLAAVNSLCSDILRVTGVGDKFEQYSVVKSAVGSFAE
jgi:anti-anti-sigma factor